MGQAQVAGIDYHPCSAFLIDDQLPETKVVDDVHNAPRESAQRFTAAKPQDYDTPCC